MSAPLAITRLGLIGGSSFLESTYLRSFEVSIIDTPHGAVIVRSNPDKSILFIQRHAADPNPAHTYSPPHLINYKAIALAFKQLQVSHVVAFGSVGSLKKTLPVGQLLVPDDWIHFTPISTFDYAKGGHVGTGLDQTIRQTLLSLLRENGYSVLDSGVYAQTLGPRFETAAEIRSLAIQGGDIVGMTCAHEATLCKELGLPYAVLCMIDNFANGIAGVEISYEEFHAGVKRNLVTMEKVLALVLERFAPKTNGNSAAVVPINKTIVDSLMHARWVVPIVPANTILENHTVVVTNGKIVDILPTEQAKAQYTATNEENFTKDVLMPGFVNAHSHLGMSLMRGYADDHCLSDWLVNHIWPGEAVFVSPEFVHDSVALGLAEMIRGGTTTCNDMYWYPEVTAKLIDKVGSRALIGLIAIDFPTSYASTPDEYLAKGLKLYEEMKSHTRINFALAPHAPYTVSDENLLRMKKMADEVCLRSTVEGAPATTPAKIHIHLHETKGETDDSATLTPGMATHRSVHKCRPIENFDTNLKLLNSSLIAVHMTQLNEQEIKRLAETNSNVVHCATSNLKLASGLCPVGALSKSGVNVALGTDSTASNNGLDMFAETKLAAILAKQVANDASCIPAFEALQMATLNGARALGMDGVTGSLEKGKSADLISVRIDDLETMPLFNVISHLVYACSRQQVENVWVAGRRLMRARQLLTLDESAIKSSALKWQATMVAEKAKQAAAKNANMETDDSNANGNSKKRGAPETEEASSAVKPKI